MWFLKLYDTQGIKVDEMKFLLYLPDSDSTWLCISNVLSGDADSDGPMNHILSYNGLGYKIYLNLKMIFFYSESEYIRLSNE